jgi:hypothetical protein
MVKTGSSLHLREKKVIFLFIFTPLCTIKKLFSIDWRQLVSLKTVLYHSVLESQLL